MQRLVTFISLSLVTLLLVSSPAHAAHISEEKAGLISMNCGSIQLQLKSLQKADSKSRVFLGSKFEFILTHLMTNLNLRLVKNNLASPSLAASQATLSSERDFFKSAFTDYSKSLDALVATDCRSNPYLFHDRLEITRTKREVVRQSYLRLTDVLAHHRVLVIELSEDL